MYTRQDVFDKYYKSDIFNTSDTNIKSGKRKAVIRPNFPTLESTKEDVFNVGRERRIQRSRNKYPNEPENNTGLNLSVDKRKKNYDKIYGSDIFNRKSSSVERRKGIKLIPNTTNKSKCFDEMINNEEYINELKYYTRTHRSEKKEFHPDLSMKYVKPQERYFRQHYEVHGRVILPETNYYVLSKDEENKNNYIKKKLYINRESYNNYRPNRSESEGGKKEIRYVRQKQFKMVGRRPFLDVMEHPRNNSRINKQIQLESHIFQNEDKDTNFKEKVKEIDERLEKEKKKNYNRNVLGMPYKRINPSSRNEDKGLFGSVHSRWARTNIDWSSPETEVMFATTYTDRIKEAYGSKGPTAFQRKLIQNADSQNLDTLSGLAKTPIKNIIKPKREDIINSETSKKLDDFVNHMPGLSDGQKLTIRSKASVLDVKNDEEFENKTRTIKEFYKKKPKIERKKEITQKVNERRQNAEKEMGDKGYHDFVLTYAVRGNQFDKLDDYEIKNIFAKKGVQIYDVNKKPFDKGGYNKITFKVKGSDANNQISDKVKLVKDDLIRKNYKINIEKEKQKNHKIGQKNILGGPRGKAIVMIDPSTKEYGSKYTTIPKDVMERKGFTRAWEGLDYEYKKFKP